MMTTEYVTLRPSMTVEESILRIRRTGVDKETIYTCYVTDNRTLLGLVTVKDLLLAEDDETPIRAIMQTHVISVSTLADQEEVARMFAKYNFPGPSVVDNENRMVGIVTFDDAMDVMEEEATEDIEIMGGMSPSEKTYSRATTWDLFKQRIPWLLLLMVSATFTGMIITGFEKCPGCPGGPHRFHSHAHGHRRQLRLPVLRDRHSGPVPGRIGVPGPASSDLEGNSDRRMLWYRAGCRLLLQNSAGGPSAHGKQQHHRCRGPSSLPDYGHYRAPGQNRRLYSAHVRQASGL